MTSILRKTCLLLLLGVVSSTPSLKHEKEIQLKTNTFFQLEHNTKPLRILAIFPLGSFSHHIMTETLMMELARRGHHVTFASPFPPKEPLPNYNHIDISDVTPKLSGQFSFEFVAQEYEDKDVNVVLNTWANMDGHKACSAVFNHSKIKPLFEPPHQFDVFFTEIFGSGCCFAIGTKLQIPSIAIATTHSIAWLEEFSGDTFNPSYIENMFLTPTSDGLSSLVERLKNTYYYLRTKMAFYYYLTRPDEIVVRDFLGSDSPSLQEIRHNVSLFMVNTHPSLFTAKPLLPRILPVGGLHLRPPNLNKLPANVKSWLDTAPNGVVYFSLGSLLRPDSIPESLFKAFVSAFQELKHLRFLWKFETSAEEAKATGIPDNVLVAKWLPQLEVLSHPNTVTFITHGGLMGSMESIYTGVPMIGLPVFAEQILNVFRFEKLGIAVRLNHRTVTQKEIVQAITKATSDSRFRQKAAEVSRLFKDRPMSPLDSAVWWTEYIVRNRGALHLESPVTTMPFWKYALLDVAAVVLAGLSVFFFTMYLVFSRCLLRNIKNAPPVKREKKKKY